MITHSTKPIALLCMALSQGLDLANAGEQDRLRREASELCKALEAHSMESIRTSLGPDAKRLREAFERCVEVSNFIVKDVLCIFILIYTRPKLPQLPYFFHGPRPDHTPSAIHPSTCLQQPI